MLCGGAGSGSDNGPQVRFRPEPNLCFADPAGRIVTAGGSTSWHDLALHIISRHVSPGEAMRIAKVYLLKWHDEGQLPYEPLVRPQPHTDAVVRGCEAWLREHFRQPGVVARAVGYARIPERTLKRRFKQATGLALIDYVQNLRVEEAKRLLEASDQAVDEIAFEIGYEDPRSSLVFSRAVPVWRRRGTVACSSRFIGDCRSSRRGGRVERGRRPPARAAGEPIGRPEA